MNRRSACVSGAAVLAYPGLLLAQPAPRWRIALLHFGDEVSSQANEEALLEGLRELGYTVGGNLVVDRRYARGDTSRLPVLADELVASGAQVLLAIEPVATMLRKRTSSIPIVLTASTDPVSAGLVRSLGRPGTNVTGLSLRNDELLAKHVELLVELVPQLARVALLNKMPLADDADGRLADRFEEVARSAAKRKGLSLAVARAGDARGVQAAFAAFERTRAQAVAVVATGATFYLRRAIIAEARRLRLPSISSLPAAWVEDGGLLNYGPSFIHAFRYAASFVHRILQGVQPAEIPLEQPAKFELAINLRTARDIGIAIPQSILLRADRLIE